MAEPPLAKFEGSCYCQSVKFTVDLSTKPVHTAFCHCHSCTKAHAAPLYWVVYVDSDQFSVTAGAEFLKDAKKPEGSKAPGTRQFCIECGSRIANPNIPKKFFKDGVADEDMTTGFFPALIENREELPPSCHPAEHGNAVESCMGVLYGDVCPTATKEANREALSKRLPVLFANSCDYVNPA